MRLTFIAKALLHSLIAVDYTRWLCRYSDLTNCDSPAIRFGREAIAPSSAPGLPLQSNGIRWDVIGSECHRYGGKVPDEYGDIRQARVPQQLHGALIKSLRYDARGYQCTGHVIDHLLPRIVKRCVQACDQCLHFLRRQARSFPDHLVLVIRIGRVPFGIDQIHYNFAFRVRQRRVALLKVPADRNQNLQQVWILKDDLVWSRRFATFFDHIFIPLLLFGGHLIDWNFGVSTESTKCHFVRHLFLLFSCTSNVIGSGVRAIYCGDAAGSSSSGTRPVRSTRTTSMYVPIT